MTNQQRAIWWLAALALLAIAIGMLRGVLLPFIVGLAMAYFLNPMADRLERAGLPRAVAAGLIVLIMSVVVAVALAFAIPLLISELRDLAVNLPKFAQELRGSLEQFVERRFGAEMPQVKERLDQGLKQLAEGWVTSLTSVLGSVATGSAALFNVASVVLITPVVAFYMLCDWHRLVDSVDGWLPRDQAVTVRRLAGEINGVLAGFVRGQGTVCLILGLLYGVGLMWAGLRSGFLIGVATGLMSFVPFVGFSIGLVIACCVALGQYWPDWMPLVKVLIVFGIGQALEGAVLSPRIVAGHIKLHPVWLIFALFTFGYLFGFVGMLVAVPTAAAIGVLARFAIEEYLKSSLYKGEASAKAASQVAGELEER